MPLRKAKSLPGTRQGTSTAEAVLGLLSMAPMSGYGMRMVISQSIGHFWSESFGQIYPALKKLTAEGYVVKKTERQKGRPDRYIYSLTTKGRERLEEWLKLPAEREVPRNELLLKLFFSSKVPVSASRDKVEQFIAAHHHALRTYDEIAAGIQREWKGNPQLPFWLMTVSYGRHYSEALVRWGNETLKALDAIVAAMPISKTKAKSATRTKTS